MGSTQLDAATPEATQVALAEPFDASAVASGAYELVGDPAADGVEQPGLVQLQRYLRRVDGGW